MGKKAREFTRIYYNAQEQMSASAVQYVRGMPVVKIFGQSVRSFRQFNAEIEAYKTYALKICDTYESGMTYFTVLLNSIVTFILPVGILLMQNDSRSLTLAAVWPVSYTHLLRTETVGKIHKQKVDSSHPIEHSSEQSQ